VPRVWETVVINTILVTGSYKPTKAVNANAAVEIHVTAERRITKQKKGMLDFPRFATLNHLDNNFIRGDMISCYILINVHLSRSQALMTVISRSKF